MLKLTLYKKKKCHLCDEMKDVLKKVREDFEFVLEEVDIETDKNLFEKYKEKIPVLLIDGKFFAKYRVDGGKLKRKLFIDN